MIKTLEPLCRWPSSWTMTFLTSQCSNRLGLSESYQAPA